MAQAGTTPLAGPAGRLDPMGSRPAMAPGTPDSLLSGPEPRAATATATAAVGSEGLTPAAPTPRLVPQDAAASPIAGEPRPPQAATPTAGVGERTRTPAYGERAIAEAELLCFANPRPGRPYEISIELPEFTCKCPFSGYPDFAVLRLIYQPGPRVVELKAIKLYVNSYRDLTISHEEVVNRILDDLVDACEPVWMELTADFNPRGNVHTVVRVSHGFRLPC